MGFEEFVGLFKDRKVKAREVFSIMEITKETAFDFVRMYHYLGNKDFLGYHNYGLYHGTMLCGVATYATPAGVSTLKGWFGLDNGCRDVLELTRLCMLPILNGTNATSFLLSNSMRALHRSYGVRAVISLADASKHVGSIYQVCGFKYYGLTDSKTDFYSVDGTRNKWGTNKSQDGVWLPRTRKHRYAFIMDKSLKCLYKEQERPKKVECGMMTECCHGKGYVLDRRSGKWYTCPRCTDGVAELSDADIVAMDGMSHHDAVAYANSLVKGKRKKATQFDLWDF